jgi:hypothetical protein
VNAIEVAKYTDHEIEAMIDGFAADVEIRTEEASAVTEEQEDFVAAHMKEYPQIWKDILATIDAEKRTIPEVAGALKMAPEMVTWHLMTMNKYGVVSPAGTNDKEEYYYYKMK